MTSPLIEPDELRQILATVRLVEVHGGTDAATIATRPHVQNAVVLGYTDLSTEHVDPVRGGRHPLPDVRAFAAKVASWGIDATTEVVVIDATLIGNDGGARAYWMLRALGLSNVRVSTATLSVLYPTLSSPTCLPAKASAQPLSTSAWLRPNVDIDAVERIRKDSAFRLYDARAANRYRGEVEPIDPIAGHIPGALSAPFQDDLKAPTEMKSIDEMRARYQALLAGADPSKVVVYCGSGVTASQTLLAMEAAGFPDVAIYMGSWSEWCRSGRELTIRSTE